MLLGLLAKIKCKEFYFLKRFYLFILEKAREGEQHQCVVASHTPPTRDLARNPGMCPRLRIESATLWFPGQYSIYWATPARANTDNVFNFIFIVDTITDVPIFLPFVYLLHLAPTPPSLWPSPHCCLYLWVMHVCSLANPFPFFPPVPSSSSPLTAVSLSHVSVPLFLFCLSIYFVH